MKNLKLLIFLNLLGVTCFAQVIPFKIFKYPEVRQGVAVDEDHFYVINNSGLFKCDKADGKVLMEWNDTTGSLEHLNSGIIFGDSLLCINTNYPESPMASSLEIFNKNTLDHIGNHSFGIFNGSATWLDRYRGDWYVAFAHYTGRGSAEGKDNSWTRLVRFDSHWRQLESWILPEKVIEGFGTRSNSGGVILSNGKILMTGHDHPTIYVLGFPKMGYKLELLKEIPVSNEGQGIAIEYLNEKEILIYGIRKGSDEVVVSKIKLE